LATLSPLLAAICLLTVSVEHQHRLMVVTGALFMAMAVMPSPVVAVVMPVGLVMAAMAARVLLAVSAAMGVVVVFCLVVGAKAAKAAKAALERSVALVLRPLRDSRDSAVVMADPAV
jgi:hypothetical protein